MNASGGQEREGDDAMNVENYDDLEMSLATMLLDAATGVLDTLLVADMAQDIEYAEPSLAVMTALDAAARGEWTIPAEAWPLVRRWAEGGIQHFRDSAQAALSQAGLPSLGRPVRTR